jgi:hypothetical protein
MRWIGSLAIAGGAALGAAAVSTVQACSLDGVPSISANGLLAHINPTQPTVATLAQWAPFVFPAPFKNGATVRFQEDRRAVLRSLPPQAFARPWRWSFGDKASAAGFTTSHLYSRPGAYIVNVWAYDASSRQWYRFDAVQIRVR